MLPTSLIVDDFFGFRHHEFDFTDFHVAVIVGKNGAGKSSIFDAIRWCLYGRYRETGGDLIIRRRAARARVELHFTARGDHWVIVREKPRDKTGTLHLYRPGHASETEHTQEETQRRINELVGLSYTALMAGPLMVQDDKRGDLMRLDPRERKDLIIEEADLTGYPALFKDASAERDIAASEAKVYADRIATTQTVIDQEPQARTTLEGFERQLAGYLEAQSLASARVIEARVAVGLAEAKVAADTQLAERMRSLWSAIHQADEDLTRHQTALTRHQTALRAQVSEPTVTEPPQGALDATRVRALAMADAAEKRAGLVATKVAMRKTLDKVPEEGTYEVPCHGEGIYAACPLLKEYFMTPESKDAFKAEWNALTDQLSDLDLTLGQRDAVLIDLQRLEVADRVYAQEWATFRERTAGAERAKEAAQTGADEATASIERVMNDIARMHGELDQVTAERRTAQAARDELERERANLHDGENTYMSNRARVTATEPLVARARALMAEVERAKEAVEIHKADLVEAQTDFDTFSVLTAAFHRDGIPSMVIEALLPLIEARANEVLARMPEDMSLRLVTNAVTKAGTVSDKLDIMVAHEGTETPFGMLSGAQQFRVNLALRLGQQRVLAARSGASIEFLLLDEADRDLDEEGVEALMETIGAIAPEFGLVMLISHHTWLTDRVATRIEVSRSNGETFATVT